MGIGARGTGSGERVSAARSSDMLRIPWFPRRLAAAASPQARMLSSGLRVTAPPISSRVIEATQADQCFARSSSFCSNWRRTRRRNPSATSASSFCSILSPKPRARPVSRSRGGPRLQDETKRGPPRRAGRNAPQQYRREEGRVSPEGIRAGHMPTREKRNRNYVGLPDDRRSSLPATVARIKRNRLRSDAA
jgi:hypothetical protein